MYRKPAGVMFLILHSASSFATAQCPPDASCGPLTPEFKVAMYASIVAFPMACAKLDPTNAARYTAALQTELGKLGAGDRQAMAEAARAPALPEILAAAAKELHEEQSPRRLLKKCGRALQRSEAGETASQNR